MADKNANQKYQPWLVIKSAEDKVLLSVPSARIGSGLKLKELVEIFNNFYYGHNSGGKCRSEVSKNLPLIMIFPDKLWIEAAIRTGRKPVPSQCKNCKCSKKDWVSVIKNLLDYQKNPLPEIEQQIRAVKH